MYNDELTKKLTETAKHIMAGESVESIEEDEAKKGDKEAYTKFFKDTLDKYGVKSPAELSDEDKKKFFDEIDAGWVADNEKPEKNESTELEEGKIDLNKKFKTSEAALDYFHSFSVADQAKSDQEVEKSKKKFSKNTLGFWMQNLYDTLKVMGISEEIKLTEEEEEEIITSILDTIPDDEAAADDDNHPDEEDILVTLDKTTGYKIVDNLPEEVEKLDARRREFREKIKKLAYAKTQKLIQDHEEEDRDQEDDDEEVTEEADLKEGSMDKMSLQDLWMDFADGEDGKEQDKKFSALIGIYKHVKKKFGKGVADDMADYGASANEVPQAKKHMKKLAKKHGIKEGSMDKISLQDVRCRSSKA